MIGGWGGTPVRALEGAQTGDLPRAGCLGSDDGVRAPSWRLFAGCVWAVPVASAARRRPSGAAEAGRAQRGLDLFLGQNRTQKGDGDA